MSGFVKCVCVCKDVFLFGRVGGWWRGRRGERGRGGGLEFAGFAQKFLLEEQAVVKFGGLQVWMCLLSEGVVWGGRQA